MENITDYIKWLGRFSFEELEYCEVDAVIFGFLSYFDLRQPVNQAGEKQAVTLREMHKLIFSKKEFTGVMNNKGDREFFVTMAGSRRFGDVIIRDFTEKYDPKTAVQFAAVTVDYKELFRFIAFRGTDESLAGWKEDFMISFTETTAQRMALEYVNRFVKPGVKNYIGGHSKGGNMALYAAGLMDTELWYPNITQVYILDAPGLCPEVMDMTCMSRIKRRLTRIIPKFSVIGKLFEPEADNKIIVDSDADGFNQHFLSAWGVDHGRLKAIKENDPKSEELNDIIREWIEDQSQEDRRVFVNEFFDALYNDGLEYVGDVARKGADSVENILMTVLGGSAQTKSAVASLSLRAAFGNSFKDIKKNGFLKWLGDNQIAKSTVMILLGVFFLVASKNILEIVSGVFFIVLALAEVIFTIKRLIKSRWSFESNKERIYISVILIAICVILFIKEQATFMFGSMIFGVSAFVLASQIIMQATDKKKETYLRVINIIESIICVIYGVSFLIIPERRVFAFSISVGIVLICDGVARIMFKLIPYFINRSNK